MDEKAIAFTGAGAAPRLKRPPPLWGGGKGGKGKPCGNGMQRIP